VKEKICEKGMKTRRDYCESPRECLSKTCKNNMCTYPETAITIIAWMLISLIIGVCVFAIWCITASGKARKA